MPEEELEGEEVEENQSDDENASIEENDSTEAELPIDFHATETRDVEKTMQVKNIDRTYETIFTTETNGDIHVIHEITLGDITITLLLTLILILNVFQLLLRR